MAMRVFNVGDVLAAADLNEYGVNTRYAVKPSDTSRPSTTTITADPDLTLPVDANKSYFVQATILYTALSGSDLKASWAVPAGAVFTGQATGFTAAYYQSGAGSLITASVVFVGNGATAVAFQLSGVLAISSTAGSMTLQWAQNVSNATPAIVKQGSSLYLRRVS